MSSDEPLIHEPELPAVPDVPYSDEAIPPEITEVAALPLAQRPHPNIGWALLWLIGFLIVTQIIVPLCVLVPIIVYQMFIAGTPQQFGDKLGSKEYQQS